MKKEQKVFKPGRKFENFNWVFWEFAITKVRNYIFW